MCSLTEETVLEAFAVVSMPMKTRAARPSSELIGGETVAIPSSDPRLWAAVVIAWRWESVRACCAVNTMMAGTWSFPTKSR